MDVLDRVDVGPAPYVGTRDATRRRLQGLDRRGRGTGGPGPSSFTGNAAAVARRLFAGADLPHDAIPAGAHAVRAFGTSTTGIPIPFARIPVPLKAVPAANAPAPSAAPWRRQAKPCSRPATW